MRNGKAQSPINDPTVGRIFDPVFFRGASPVRNWKICRQIRHIFHTFLAGHGTHGQKALDNNIK